MDTGRYQLDRAIPGVSYHYSGRRFIDTTTITPVNHDVFRIEFKQLCCQIGISQTFTPGMSSQNAVDGRQPLDIQHS